MGSWVDKRIRKYVKKDGVFLLHRSTNRVSTPGKWIVAAGDERCMNGHPIPKGSRIMQLLFPYERRLLESRGIYPFICEKHLILQKNFRENAPL